MRTLIVGLGVQGKKRRGIAGQDVVATVDPVNPTADYVQIEDAPLDKYDTVLVCTPDHVKLPMLRYLLTNRKHVLVEKPLLAESDVNLRELIALARQNSVCCYTAYNHRFEPHIMSLKAFIDAGKLGTIYTASFFYGNGTARDVRNSPWRDKGMGVLSDLGSHLLDIFLFLFERRDINFTPLRFSCFENGAYDHAIFASTGASGAPLVTMETSLLSWRNTFCLDIHGEHGSAHIDCLCKWGPSTFTTRARTLPSGKPQEQRSVLEKPDPTWALEYDHFKALCRIADTNLDNDLWINNVLKGLSAEQPLEAGR